MGALLQTLGFQQFASRFKFSQTAGQLCANQLDRLLQGRARGHIVGIGKDGNFVQPGGFLACQRIKFPYLFYFIAKQADPPGPVFQMGWKDFDIIAAHAKAAAHKIQIIAPILQFGQIAEQGLPLNLVFYGQTQGHGGIGFH